jgi:pimeloyl-ACP methyl ester carboxylesterase
MIRRFLAVTLFTLAAVLSQAQPSLPSSFQAKTIHSPEGADIFVRWGGSGPVVLLIHGYAENSDSWAPLAADLMKDHTVVVPDIRGIGRSSKPAGGYEKKTQAKDMRAVVTSLGYDKTFVVAHDIGNMVAYAYAAMYPDKVERLVVMGCTNSWDRSLERDSSKSRSLALQLSWTGCGAARGRPGAHLL